MTRPPREEHAPAPLSPPPRGGRMPPGDATEILLATLAQLAQFGLDAEGHPLLERREEGR